MVPIFAKFYCGCKAFYTLNIFSKEFWVLEVFLRTLLVQKIAIKVGTLKSGIQMSEFVTCLKSKLLWVRFSDSLSEILTKVFEFQILHKNVCSPNKFTQISHKFMHVHGRQNVKNYCTS